jgi:rhodanese-related sulfurtransferase
LEHASPTPPLSLRHIIEAAWVLAPELTPARAKARLDAGEVDLLLDVRERDEWGLGRLPGALNAPRGLLEWLAGSASARAEPALTRLRGRTDAHILIYCGGEGRSLLAAQTLQRMGYPNVAVIGGGFDYWFALGLPVERSPS